LWEIWGIVTTSHPKILVAEDSYLLAEVIGDYLRDCGMEPVGPVGRLEEACNFARERALDAAVLDVKLGDFLCFPVASVLVSRGIPFVFFTGYSGKALIPPAFREAPLVCKPCDAEALVEAINSLPAARWRRDALPLPLRSGHPRQVGQLSEAPRKQ
jgi:CheY-like chemotaxis protein